MPAAKINGINIEYTVTGHDEPLVMIMGLSASQSLWEPQVKIFKNLYQVITFDNRGAGKSDKPAGPYSIKMLVDDTIGLMDHLGIIKANILGISMGGMIAQEMAISYPQRVNKLILGCTYACIDGLSSGPTPKLAQIARLPPSKVGMAFLNLAYNKPFYRLSILFRALVRSKFSNHAGKTDSRDGFTGQVQACMKHNTLNRLPLIKAHTLVIVGSKDRVIKPSSSEVISKLIPGSKLVIVKNGSHCFSAEMKNEFNKEVLSFLKHSQ
jgi:pimeloyl-ACP methyl ester carboxylesterase